MAAGDAFTVIQTDLGSNPVADGPDSVLTMTSPSGSILITGDAGADAVEFELNGGVTIDGDGDIVTPGDVSANALTLSSPLDIASGGTGLSSVGTAGQLLRTNAGATAFEHWTPSFNASVITAGTLGVANGGTNSSTALNNNRVMISSSSAIVEASAITAARALISDANGIPTHSAVTSTELALLSGKTSVGDCSTSISSSTNNRIALFDSTTGKLIKQDSAVTVASGSIAGLVSLAGASALAIHANANGIPQINLDTGTTYIGRNDQPCLINLGASAAGAGSSTLCTITTLYNSSQTPRNLEIYGGLAGPTNTSSAASVLVRGGDSRTTTTSGTAGPLVLRGGSHMNTGGSGVGQPITVEGGNAAGSGAGGNAIVQGGTSGSGTAGTVQLGRTSTTNAFIFNTETAGSAGASASLYWRVNINGTFYKLELLADS